MRGERRLLGATFCAALGLLIAGLPARSQAQSPVLDLLLRGPDTRTRVAAALTVGRLRPPGAREALERALDDRASVVRVAAASALGTLGDAGALAGLGRHAGDSDANVRGAIERSMAQLSSRSGAPVGAGAAPLPTLAAPPSVAHGANHWSTARYGLVLGSFSNRAGGRAALVDVMRRAIITEVERTEDMACSLNSPPPEALRRTQGGQLRVFALEGSVHSLRRWVVASTLSVRAEVSLVLLAQPARSMLGSLSGAATAQDPSRTDDDAALRLEQRALEGAVRGALSGLRASLAHAPHH